LEVEERVMVLERTVAGADLAARLRARTARVGVLGLGYAGLPMAVALGEAGYSVVGLDVDAGRARVVDAGRSPVTDVSDAAVRTLVEAGRLLGTTEMSALAGCDVALICVPTPLDPSGAADLSFVRAAGRALAGHLHPDMLIVLQSTVPPGTTRGALAPLLALEGLEPGRDYFLAYGPERIDPGSRAWHIGNTPKLVGGLTPRCTELAVAFLGGICETVVACSSPEVAELSKLVENSYRFINIGFVNEVARLCDRLGISAWEVIDAAATKPFAFQAHHPGPGVGGHCIPVVPFHLAAVAREHGLVAELVEAAGRVNADQPGFVVSKLRRLLEARGIALHRARLLCLGVTYKPDVADLRESAAVRVVAELCRQGADVRYWDPYFPTVTVGPETLTSTELDDAALDWADAVVLLVPHRSADYTWIARRARLVLDTANRLAGLRGPNIAVL
jgi:UDP-N-acetyl-D-glucosamine dehydrogenase